MKTIEIYAPLDYIMGHLRGAHFEGTITLTDEQYAKFKANPVAWCYEQDYFYNELPFVLDDYRVEDVGSVYEVEYTEVAN